MQSSQAEQQTKCFSYENNSSELIWFSLTQQQLQTATKLDLELVKKKYLNEIENKSKWKKKV